MYAIIVLIEEIVKALKDYVFLNKTSIKIANYLTIKIPNNKKTNPYFVRAAFGIAESIRTTWEGLDSFFLEIEGFLEKKDSYRIFNVRDDDGEDEFWKLYRINDGMIRIILESSFYGSHKDTTNTQVLYNAIQAYKNLVGEKSDG